MNKQTGTPLIVTLAVLILSTPLVLAGDTTGLAVDGDRAKEYIRTLASAKFEGRKSATDGYRKAADWVAARFREWGLEPAGEDGTYFQKVPIRDFNENIGVPELSINGRRFHLDDRDFSLHSLSTPVTSVEAEVVFAGYGISATDKGLDEYAGVDVKGKVVLVLKGSPATAPEGRTMFSRSGAPEETPDEEDMWAEEARDEVKIKTAHDKGAAAILLYDPEAPEEDSGRRFWMSRRSRRQEFEPARDFLCFTIEERVFMAVMKKDAQETQRGTTRRVDALRRGIKEGKAGSHATGARASLKGYDEIVRHNEENGNNTARNVLARISGTDPELRDEYIVIGAHLDHMGVSDGYIYNGADDNASGTAVAMEVARTLAESGFEPRRTIVFGCWCGEEIGLLGSNHYVENPCGGVSMDRVVTNFNIDMIGRGDTIGASGALNFPSIWEVIARGQDPDVMEAIDPSTGGPGGSDHSAFIELGIEAMLLITQGGDGHPDYHQPEDDWEKIDPEILRKTGQFVLQGTMNLANETDIDLLIENREQKYLAQRLRISNFNPDLPESNWQYVTLDADDKEGLYDAILVEALKAAREAQPQQRGFGFRPGDAAGFRASDQPQSAPARPRQSLNRGLADLSVFEGDIRLLEIAAEFYGFGRVDIKGDDGSWIAGGRLTESGRAALSAMEKKNIAVHLASPGEELIGDLLEAASKPFLITGDYVVSEASAGIIAEKGVILGIGFDPGDVDGFIDRLERAKELVGKKENLVVYLTATEGLDESKAPLYSKLIERGWTREEISGDRRRRGGLTGGNLRALGGMRQRQRRFGGDRGTGG